MQRANLSSADASTGLTPEGNQAKKSSRSRRKKVSKLPIKGLIRRESLKGSLSQSSRNLIDDNTDNNLDQVGASTDNCIAGKDVAQTSHDGGSSGSGHAASNMEEEDSVIKRLNALKLSNENIDLTEQQHNLNRQDQADEVLALQAIFGEDFALLEANESDEQAYMISIHVEVPSVLDVLVKLRMDSNELPKDNSSQDLRVEGSNSAVKIRACTLQYLPPLRLIYRPLAYYPSHRPPNFVLSALWLSEDELTSLCQGLDALWEEQVGDVVIYTWAEWLLTNCLPHLGIINELEVESSRESKRHEGRVFSGSSSPDMVIPVLMRYNEERKNDSFLNSLHTCYICYNEQLGKNFVKLPCKHFFCIGCMKQFTSINVKEGSVKSLICPDTTCKGSIPPMVLKQLLEHDEYVRWETLLLQKTLESMVDVVYCPRCETICIEEEDHYVQCTGCLFNFCSLCRGPRHVGQECMSPEARLEILEGRQKGLQSGEDKRRKEQNYVNELLNLKYMKAEAKQCPSCKMAISKDEGCNKVTCSNCGQYFCYKCNKAIKGYDHFREGCVLFDEVEIERWEMAMNAGRAPGPELRGQHIWRACPNCRQDNIKEGNNNHIFCWSCQQHFCALCRKMVRRSADHFGSGPNKCKQHTAD